MNKPPNPSEQGFIHIAQELGITLSAEDAPLIVAALNRAYGTGRMDGAAAEREACAQVCDELAKMAATPESAACWMRMDCATAIRARGAA